jgi:hypothetical protein
MYYKTAGACTADTLVQVDVLVHGSCYSPDPLYSFAPKCTPGSPFITEQVCSLSFTYLSISTLQLASCARHPPLSPPFTPAAMLSFNGMFLRLFYDAAHRLLSCASIVVAAAAAAAATIILTNV